MKKLILPMLITAFALSLTSCRKDKKETDNSQATVAKLQGKWDATKYIEKVYEQENNKLVSEETEPYPSNSRTIAYKDHQIFYYRNGVLRDSLTYAIVGTEIRLREGNSGIYYQLKIYSDTQHSHIEEEFYTSNKVKMKSTVETFYIKK